MTTVLSPSPIQKFFDNNGQPLANGLLFTYKAGTSTKQATFVDSTGGTPNTNPIVLDYRGECRVWIDPTLAYKFVLAPSTDIDPPSNPFWSVDNISAFGLGLNFDLTATDTGIANAIAVSIPTLSSPVAFSRIVVKVANTNTGATTITVNGGTAKAVTLENLAALSGKELLANGIYQFIFDGAEWILQCPALQPTQLRTAAENSAGVTVVNPWYPPLYVDRYGNNTTPGTTDMTAAFNAAIKVAKAFGGGTVVYGATGTYATLSPIDCTQATGSTQYGWTLRQDGNFTASTLNPPTYPTIIAKHTGHVFDCAGATAINFENITLGTDATTFPQTGWFLARNTAGSSQLHRFTKCMVHGKFSNSVVYNYGSEDEQYVGCQFFNVSTGAGTRVITWTGSNISSLTSTFISIATGVQSCIDHQVIGGQFWNASSDTAADVFYLEGSTDSLKIIGPWVKCGVQGGAGGRAIVYVDGTNAMANFVSIYNMTTEHSGGGANQNKYGVLFSNNARTPTNWLIDGGVWDNQTFALACAGTNPTLDNFFIRGMAESVTHGISVPGTLQGSYVMTPTVLTLGTSKQNFLVGDSSNFAITTRNNDYWLDVGAINKTWTPNTGALTITGALTVSNKKIGLIGNKMFFTVTLQAATSIVCANNTSLTGLPFAAAVQSADVTVTNGTTGASIGNGYVFGTTIKLPAINVTTDVVTISGSSFVS